ncbi:MAG: hypothetical protein OIF58_14565, partial [Cohaesibacter sp.]|nr:hypothetical protein [Cohaesibacter sp.]
MNEKGKARSQAKQKQQDKQTKTNNNTATQAARPGAKTSDLTIPIKGETVKRPRLSELKKIPALSPSLPTSSSAK